MKFSKESDKKHVFICSCCGCSIREGDKVWHILGEQFCKNCIESSEEVARCEIDE